MQGKVDVCQDILFRPRVAEGDVIQPDFIFLFLGLQRFAVLKFKGFRVFKSFPYSGNVKGLLIQCIKFCQNTCDPCRKAAYRCKEE